jgi:phosphohistidine phosphatase
MKKLILFRHAKAAHIQGTKDFDRPLDERGREVSPKIGQYLKDEGILPDFVLVSPAHRTRETWDLARPPLEPVAMRIEHPLYESPAGPSIELLQGIDDSVKSVMIVGHNPSIHEFAKRLIGYGDRYAAARLNEKFPTAAIAVMDFDVETWAEVAERGARLDRFITPKDLGIVSDE